MIYITHVRLQGGQNHEHITEIRWQNPDNGNTGQGTADEIIDWIEQQHGVAKIKYQPEDLRVGVVNTIPKYLRTYCNGQWADNLLALPRF